MSKKISELTQKIDKLKNLVDRQEQYSRHSCHLVHGIAETNDENMDGLVLKTVNEKLDIFLFDRSHRIDKKKYEHRSRPIFVK